MKTTLITIAAAGFAALSFASGAMAQTETTSFAMADADTSGDVILAEAQAVWPEITQEAFEAADSDKSGSLNQAEYDAYSAGLPAPTPVQ